MRGVSTVSSRPSTAPTFFRIPTRSASASSPSRSTPCYSGPRSYGQIAPSRIPRFVWICGKAIYEVKGEQGDVMTAHDHDHNHDHSHHLEPESPTSIRVRALESLLIEKGLMTSDVVDRIVTMYEEDIGPHNGAKVIARAWADPVFKKRLRADGTAAIGELGFGGVQLQVIENTPETHNMVVCTLCSCYPSALIGLPPTWYKSFEYRSRAVIEPRVVLSEFGLESPESVEVC